MIHFRTLPHLLLLLASVRLFLPAADLQAQSTPAPVYSWTKSYSDPDLVNAITDVNGGIVYVGSWSLVGPEIGKMDLNGNITRLNGYPGLQLTSVASYSDGGFVVCAVYQDTSKVWKVAVVRTDSVGKEIWRSSTPASLGGTTAGGGGCIIATADGDIVAVGSTLGTRQDIFAWRLQPSGDTRWVKTFGGDAAEIGRSVQEASNGDLLIDGSTRSFGKGGSDLWALRTNNLGDSLWSAAYGGVNDETGGVIKLAGDGSFYLAGDVTPPQPTEPGMYVVKATETGDTLWTRVLSGKAVVDVLVTGDGGCLLAGSRLVCLKPNAEEKWNLGVSLGGYTPGYSLTTTLTCIAPCSGGGWILGGNLVTYNHFGVPYYSSGFARITPEQPYDSVGSWQQVTSLDLTGAQASSIAAFGRTVFVGCNGAPWIYRSSDDGLTWSSPVFSPSPPSSGSLMRSFARGSGQSQRLFVASPGTGLYASDDDGQTWSLMQSFPTIYPHSLSVAGQEVYASVPGTGLFHSTDNGGSWTAVVGDSVMKFMKTICNTGTRLLGSGTESYNGMGLWTSSNGGLNWSMEPESRYAEVSSFALLPADVFAACWGWGYIGHSPDGGATWENVMNNIPTSFRGPFYDVTTAGQTVFGATGSSLLQSNDRGHTWLALSSGISEVWWKGGNSAMIAAGSHSLFAVAPWYAGWGQQTIWRRYLSDLISGVESTGGNVKSIASDFVLCQNYPNPFNPSTIISYGLPHSAHVTLAIYNTLGQKVATLVNGRVEAGYHDVHFDAGRLASGVYLYRLQAGSFVQVKKLIVLK